MELDKLIEIKKFAEMLGFKAVVRDEKYAYFSISNSAFDIEVIYDPSYMTGYRGTTISNSSFNTTNMEAMDAFSIGYQKAIILAKKLHDVV